MGDTAVDVEASWRNWAGNQTVVPARRVQATSVDDVRAAVLAAADDGLRVRTAGSGHSFTAAVGGDGGVLLELAGDLVGVVSVGPRPGEVTVGAGTPLHLLHPALRARSLAMSNLGDIDRQTLAGALATGTHGTGWDFGGLATQVVALELVLADGSLVRCSADERLELFGAARVGLGAYGVVTAVTLACEPDFRLLADEHPVPLASALDGFDGLMSSAEHVEFYWFPHTDVALTKRNQRVGPGDEPARLAGWRRWVDDELLSNGVFAATQRLAAVAPAVVPALNQVSARALTARRYSDESYRVFTSRRRVRFREMEYALPREAVPGALREIARVIDRAGVRAAFPMEVRAAAADDVWLSTAHGRATGYIAVHSSVHIDHRPLFDAVEPVLVAAAGRPHWGKLHTLDAAALAGRYPRFADALRVRDEVDPQRRFGSVYLERVLGS